MNRCSKFLGCPFQMVIACILLVLLSNCKKEVPLIIVSEKENIESEVETKVCDDLEAIRLRFFEEEQSDNFVIGIEKDSSNIVFYFENETYLSLDSTYLVSYTIDKELWWLELEYKDAVSQKYRYIGELSLQTQINPSEYNPLAVIVNLTAPIKGQAKARVIGINGEESDAIRLSESFSVAHDISVLGLYPDYENQIEITFTKVNGTPRVVDTLLVQTEPLPSGFPEIEVTIRKSDQMAEGWTLVSYLGLWSPNIPFIMDGFGDIRWFLDYRGHPLLHGLLSDTGLERLQNGNYYFGDIVSNQIYEVDALGRIIQDWPLPAGYRFHHNVQEKPDGNFLITVSKDGSIHLNGEPAIEDYVIEIDRGTGGLVHEWDFKELLDENRTALGDWLSTINYTDWLHLNSVIYDESDNTIIVSGRHQGVAKVGYDNQLRWILGAHKGWEQNRMEQNLNDFLLCPINETGVPYNTDLKLGYLNAPSFEWNWYQHSPELMPNGNLLLFDNGEFRNFSGLGNYSQAVEFKINESEKTVHQIWSYGKERGLSTFSKYLSDVDFLPNKNNILFTPGYQTLNGVNKSGGKIVEIDYDTKEVVFEVNINNPNPDNLTLHRSERLTLYPN